MNKEKRITINGRNHSFKEWAEITGINLNTIKTRYNKGIRGSGLIEPVGKNRSENPSVRIADYIHKAWGGRWVYGKPRKYYRDNLYWAFTAK